MRRVIQWLTKPFRKHVHDYSVFIMDIPMENNTNYLIFQCKCGHVKVTRVHRESEMYKSLECKGLEKTKRMYSEKEVIEIVEKSRATGLTAEYLILTEQFKKK
jgi:hypothetical protein